MHGDAGTSGSTEAASTCDGAVTADAPPPADASTADGTSTVTPGWSLVAIDTPLRTYLDYVNVPQSGVWTPEANGWPILAQWEKQTTRTGMRFQSFTPGKTPAQIIALLPRLAPAAAFIDITAAPYGAPVAPADATSAIQAALDAAGKKATPTAPVDGAGRRTREGRSSPRIPPTRRCTSQATGARRSSWFSRRPPPARVSRRRSRAASG